MEKHIERLETLTKTQCINGTWNYNAYHFGLANGLILALATMKDEKPQFLRAPTQWLEDRKAKGMPFIALGRWSSASGRWFVRERIYWKGWKWTPFVRVSRRHKGERCGTRIRNY